MEWYYAVGGEQKGPVSDQELQRLAQQGAVTPQTLVWREGMAGWQPYGGGTPPAMPGNVTGAALCVQAAGAFSLQTKSFRWPAALIAQLASRSRCNDSG